MLNGTRARWVALVILIGALALRMGWPTLTEFKLDEANVIRHAQAIAWTGYRPLAGVRSSFGATNLPLTLYLTAIPLRFWQDPISAVLFISLLNGLAVWATYHLIRKYFNPSVGLLAAFLFAVNAWATLLGRKIWCRTLPLFTIFMMEALFATFTRKRP